MNANVKLDFRKKEVQISFNKGKKWLESIEEMSWQWKKLTLIQMNIRFGTMYVSIESKNDY